MEFLLPWAAGQAASFGRIFGNSRENQDTPCCEKQISYPVSSAVGDLTLIWLWNLGGRQAPSKYSILKIL